MRRAVVLLTIGAALAPGTAMAGQRTLTAAQAAGAAEPTAYADAKAHDAPQIKGPTCSVYTRSWSKCRYTFYLRPAPGEVTIKSCTRKLDVRWRGHRPRIVVTKHRLVCTP